MTSEHYHATLNECLSLVWEAQLKLEAAFDALAAAHIAIRAAGSADRVNAAINCARDNGAAA